MNAKTLLLLPPWSGRNHSLFLGTCDLRSFLVEKGIEVEILDCDVISFGAEREGLSVDESISNCIKDYEKYTLKECQEMGINDSMIHEDFMIGTDDLEITGIDKKGRRHPIFKDGNWAF